MAATPVNKTELDKAMREADRLAALITFGLMATIVGGLWFLMG